MHQNIETPSVIAEVSRGVDSIFPLCLDYRGYSHHRYIIWSDIENNIIYFLPKMPIVEIMSLSEELQSQCFFLLNNYPVYWNNYFIYDSTNPPKIVIFKHGVNYDIVTDTPGLILSAINTTIKNTNYFIEKYCK